MPTKTPSPTVDGLTARITELQGQYDAALAMAKRHPVPLGIAWSSTLGNTIRPEGAVQSHELWIAALEAERALTLASLELARYHLDAVDDVAVVSDDDLASLSRALDEAKERYRQARAAYFHASQAERMAEERRAGRLTRVRQVEAELARVDGELARHREQVDAAQQEIRRREIRAAHAVLA